MRSRSAVLLAVAAIPVVLGACGGRDATAPSPGRWLGAERIDDAPSHPFAALVGFPALGVDGSGRAIAVWGQESGIRSRQFVPGRGWGPPDALPKTGSGNAVDPQVAVNGIGTAEAIWRQTETPESGPLTVWSSRREPTGGWSAPAAIDGGELLDGAGQIAVALDPAGNAIALWTSDGIVAARDGADGGWRPPERLSRSGASPAVVVDIAGRALATWSEPEAGVARQYVPGRGWLDVTRFGPDGEGRYYGPGRVAFDSSGRAVLVWERRSGGEFGPVVVWAARFDGRGWSGQSVISDRAVKSVFPVVAVDARGALAVWTQFAFPNEADDGVVSRHAGFGSSWESPLRFSTAQDAVTTALAMNLHGEAVAAWAQLERLSPSSDLQYRLWVSRYAGGQWTPAEPLQAGPGWAQSPIVAIDQEGNATVAWVEHDGAPASIWANRFQVDRR